MDSNFTRSLLRSALGVMVLAFAPGNYARQRVLEPADLSRFEQLSHRYATFTISPDRELLAFVVERPKTRSTPGPAESLLTEERCDVWLTSLRTSKTWNLTNGIATAAGFFMPTWSPDGQHLAMVSSRKNSDSIVVWDRRIGRMRDVVDQALDYWYPNEPSMVWSSDESLLCFLRPRGRRASGIEGQRLSAEIATREWKRSWEGKEPTASVIDSGIEPSLSPKTELTSINIRTGKAEKLAVGAFRSLQISPDRKYFAFLKQAGKFRPEAGKPLTTRSFRRYSVLGYQLEITDHTGASVTPTSLTFFNPDSIKWSPSSQYLSVVAEDPNSPEGTLWTYQLNLQSKTVLKLDGEAVEDAAVELVTNKSLKFPVPAKDATLVGFDQDKTAVFTASNRTGTYVWLADAGETTPRLIYESNQFVRDVAEGQRQLIEYKSLDRKALKAWIVLPPDYENGKRYPVVTWVYPGAVLGDKPPGMTGLNSSLPLNLQLFAAHGYVVLIPSIPLSPAGQVSDTYAELLNGVLPAIDKLVELGIGDPDRVALAGHSWGGYATLALITQTRRFKTAIALAGISDYFSFYTGFSLPRRYLDEPLEFPRAMVDVEGLTAVSLRFGNPPWKNFGLYLRNNPMFFVERVETPLLLIHGDMDLVPIEQAEQFFSALYRQGKRARFVRYWGEGHLLNSPQNVNDMWSRIYEWLEEGLSVRGTTFQN